MGFASLVDVNATTGSAEDIDRVVRAAVPTRANITAVPGAGGGRGEWLRDVISGANATPGWLRARFLNKTYDAPRRHKLLSGILRDDGASLGWADGPDVIVLGSGAHDLGSRNFSLGSYAAHARATWELIVGAIPRHRHPRPHLIWVSTGSVHVRPENKRGGNLSYCPNASDEKQYVQPIPVVREMDVITRRLAHEYGADVLDQAKLRELSPYDGDGLHCVRGIVCQASLDALLELIEMGPVQHGVRES